MTAETIGTIVGIVLGAGAILGAVYKFWSLPDKVESVIKKQAELEAALKVAQEQATAAVGQQSKASAETANTAEERCRSMTRHAAEAIKALERQHRDDLQKVYERINQVASQGSSERVEAASVVATLREVYVNIRDRLAAFEKVEAEVSKVLQVQAETRAKVERVEEDARNLADDMKRMNREIGEIKAKQ